jgi:hypothetical protein
MQNLIETLKDFKSKERFFLAGQILGNPDFTLSSEFREKLSGILEIPVPAQAFSAMDYHLDWLYAGLNLAKDGNPADIYPNGDAVIKGQQEDLDWLIAFREQNEYHLVLIEAKGVTGWTNRQMISKANRLGEIFGRQGNAWPGIVPHFVIMSPRLPQRLMLEQWPDWMAPEGKIKWLELAVPERLIQVYRCDEHGQINQAGRSWKVKQRKNNRIGHDNERRSV